MELKKLKCPECGANFESDEKVSFCSHCGAKLYFDDGNRNINYNYKTEDIAKIKEIEMKKEQEVQRRKDEPKIWIGLLLFFLICFGILGMMAFIGDKRSKSQEEELQSIVNEIYVDIDNGEYEKALIKANSLYYTYGGTESSTTKKWNSTRESLIQLIEEKMKN